MRQTTPWLDEYGPAESREAQDAYVAATKDVLRFTAHTGAWHWYNPSTRTIYTRLRRSSGLEPGVITTTVPEGEGIDWQLHARRAVGRMEDKK